MDVPDRPIRYQQAMLKIKISSVASRAINRLSNKLYVLRMNALWEATELPDADRIMIRALSDEYPMVRREAVRVLGEIASQEATNALTQVAAHDTSSEVREEAIAALGEVIRRRRASSL